MRKRKGRNKSVPKKAQSPKSRAKPKRHVANKKDCCKRNPLCPCRFPTAYKSPYKRFLKFICQMRRGERLRIVALIRVEILKRGISGVQVGTKTVYPFELAIQTKSAALRWNEAGVQAAWFLSGQGDKKKYLECLGVYALRSAENRSKIRKTLNVRLNRRGMVKRKGKK